MIIEVRWQFRVDILHVTLCKHTQRAYPRKLVYVSGPSAIDGPASVIESDITALVWVGAAVPYRDGRTKPRHLSAILTLVPCRVQMQEPRTYKSKKRLPVSMAVMAKASLELVDACHHHNCRPHLQEKCPYSSTKSSWSKILLVGDPFPNTTCGLTLQQR